MRPNRTRARRVKAFIAALCAVTALWALTAGGTLAQPITVVAGEHRDFTRVVLQSSASFSWSVQRDGTGLRITLPARGLRLDPGQLFARIPRTRLAAARAEGNDLVLTLACPCTATSFEDRPGVVVLDLHNAPSPAPAAAPDPAPAAGRAVARRLGFPRAEDQVESQGPPAAAPDPGVLEALRATLATGLATAMTQGLVTGPGAPGTPQAQVLPGPVHGPAPALPANLRLRGAADAPPQPEPVTAPNPACPGEAELAFLDPPPQPFAEHLASLRMRQFGEFDAPDAGVRLDLAHHYLTWGLGAEARQILDARPPPPGANLLVAIADILDGIASNRRADLARLNACKGWAGFFAMLAGPPDAGLAAAAERFTAPFLRLPAPLRAVIGPELMERVLSAGDTGSARIILDALAAAPVGERPARTVLARLEARLEWARGAGAQAGARLTAEPELDLDARRLALELALAEGRPAPPITLDEAVAMAEPLRGTGPARATMELAIRHHGLAGRIAEGLALTDRYGRWLEPTPANSQRLADLRGALWNEALASDDAAFLELILARADWREPGMQADVRADIATRLRDLGLGRLVTSMAPGTAGHESSGGVQPSPAVDDSAADPGTETGGAGTSRAPAGLAAPAGQSDAAPPPVATVATLASPVGAPRPRPDSDMSTRSQGRPAPVPGPDGPGPAEPASQDARDRPDGAPRPPSIGEPMRRLRPDQPVSAVTLGGTAPTQPGPEPALPPDPALAWGGFTRPLAGAFIDAAGSPPAERATALPRPGGTGAAVNAMAASQQALRDSEALRIQMRALLGPP